MDLLLATSRGGYAVGEQLQITCPYWDAPTAINVPRKARVIRNAMMPNFEFALALQYLPGVCEEEGVAGACSPFTNQVRVLGVESNPQMAERLRELLEQDGYSIVVTGKAQQALEILQTETPDVIVAEAEGGEISGNDLCAIVKTCPRLKHIPVILLTNPRCLRITRPAATGRDDVHDDTVQTRAAAPGRAPAGAAAGALFGV